MTRNSFLLLLGLTILPTVVWAQWPTPKPRDTRLYDQMQQDAQEGARLWQQEQQQRERDRYQQFKDFERERREDRRNRQLRDAIEERER